MSSARLLPLVPLSASAPEFALFQKLIYREAGIFLAEHKRSLLAARLAKRVRALGLSNLGAYHRVVVADEAERVRMLECICTHETRFFREPDHFRLLADRILPTWKQEGFPSGEARRLRAWSAGCSTGEEPFSLAMVAKEALPADSYAIEIRATDLSAPVLERAASATWPMAQAAQIPPRLLKQHMLRGTGSQEGLMRASPGLRKLVRFSQLNLHALPWPSDGLYDLIFCRNVLIYFDAASKRRVVEGLLDRLAPGGYLFLGHAESLAGLSARARGVAPTVYTSAGGSGVVSW